jgi:predicted nucleotide-binding protein
MYYHVIVATTEKVGKKDANKTYFELDKTSLSEVVERVIHPFLRNDAIQFDGYFLKHSEIRRIAVRQSDKSSKDLSQWANDNMPAGIIMYVSPSDAVVDDDTSQDITSKVFDDAKVTLSAKKPSRPTVDRDLTRVFIVHGRDDLAKTEAARFIEKLGFVAVILHEQASAGRTIIEKFEEHTSVGFALVLYTPCDVGGLAEGQLQPRARQNVVFEHGYLIGKLGRQNVCALVKSDVEIPNDISGVVYVPLDQYGAWHAALAKELRKAGYDVDMNKVI